MTDALVLGFGAGLIITGGVLLRDAYTEWRRSRAWKER